MDNKMFLKSLLLILVIIGIGCSNIEDFKNRSDDLLSPVPGNSGQVSASAILTNGLTLNWSKADDTVSSQEKLSYCIYYSVLSNIATVAEAEVNGTPFGGYQINIGSQSVTGLQHSTSYYFTVVVKDEAGNKAIYRSVSKTTLEGVAPTVAVGNAKNNRKIFSGFIVGTAADNDAVSTVEVSLDGGAYQIASGTTSWKFKLPTGAATWKRGSQHTISVRAKDNAGNYSAVVSLTVRKGINKDVNGDGYADLVIGAPHYNSYQGRVYIFHGTVSGISSSVATSANTVLTGELTGRFGIAVTTGDINGDGYADIVVGAAYYSVTGQDGRAYVFNGSSSGVTSRGAGSADTIISETSGMASLFGFSVATGDVNGDGYEDLIVGAFVSNGGKGTVYLFYGSVAGIASTTSGSANVTLTGEASSRFGWRVFAADINGDGYLDLIVGAPQYNSYQGRSYLFYGSSSGIATMGAGSADCIITGEVNSRFGCSVVAGDINGDGLCDLIVGARGYNSYQGRVYIFHASSSGIASVNTGSADSILNGEAGSSFGYSIAVGLVNSDNYADVLVGAYQYGTSLGRAYLFHGSSSGIGSVSASGANTLLTGESPSYFGLSVDMSDLNSDGFEDLIVGAPAYSSDQGRVYLFSGGSSGVNSMNGSSAAAIFTGETSSRFGESVW